MYYSVGLLHFKEAELKQRQEVIEYFGFEIADLKTLLLDIDGCTRGLGGCKKPFDIKMFPSYSKFNNNKNLVETHETDEERLKRHIQFFESLKKLAKNNNEKE